MLCVCNCKINLGLQIIGKRPDGYHDLESLFYPVPFGDTLEILPAGGSASGISIQHLHEAGASGISIQHSHEAGASGISIQHSHEAGASGISIQDSHEAGASGISIQHSGIPLPGGEENILEAAYRNLQRQVAVPAVTVNLHKHIPPGTGLGGASSSAAHFLIGMKELFGLRISDASLREVALQTGSDCPFFLQSAPALVSGRGEIVTPYPEVLKGYRLVILYAGIRRSTQEAFAGLQLHGHEERLAEILLQSPGSWAGSLKNDFELAALRQWPELLQQRQRLYNAGAFYASLTGSGSCIFGLFSEKPDIFFEDSLFQGTL
jgi:4-diphosphocytidyl-2-C-methyl-D-erythritol kinase